MTLSARDQARPLSPPRCYSVRGRASRPSRVRTSAPTHSSRWRTPPCATLLLALTSIACANSESETRLQFDITHYEHLGPSTAPIHLAADSLAVEGRSGSILVTGTIWLPDHCDDLRAQLVDHPPVLELRLRQHQARGHDGGCEASNRSVLVAYRAEIANLPPGTYRLRVLDEGHAEYVWLAGGSKPPERISHLHDETVTVR